MTIILFLAFIGLLLIFLEFFMPGAVLAVIGTVSLLVSVGLFFMKYSAVLGILYLISLLIALFFTCKVAMWTVKRSHKKGDFYHGEDQEGYTASSFEKTLIGQEGIVSTELKPAGHIEIHGKVYQALSESGFISSGARVEVIGGKGSHLIVKERKI